MVTHAWAAGGSVVVTELAHYVDRSRRLGLVIGVGVGVAAGIVGALVGTAAPLAVAVATVLLITGGGRWVRAGRTLRHGAAQRRIRDMLPAHTHLAVLYRHPGDLSLL